MAGAANAETAGVCDTGPQRRGALLVEVYWVGGWLPDNHAQALTPSVMLSVRRPQT